WDTSGLSNGSSHTLSAIIYDIAGNTLTTASSSITIQAGAATVPSAPTITSIVAGATNINLQWGVPPDGGSAITSYNVYRSTSRATETFLVSPPSSSTTLGDIFFATENKYYYKVSAVNSVGEVSRSKEVSAPTPSSTIPGDFNSDGLVTITDLSFLFRNYGTAN